MAKETKKVVFANKKLEEDFKRLARSRHPEDARTYRALQGIRSALLKQHSSGTEIPKERIPRAYQRMFNVSNLWSLDVTPHGAVLFSRVGDELRIVDVV